MSNTAFTRAVTVFAVGFLALDAVLFALVNRVLWAVVFGVAAVLVVLGWRWYRRAMAELADARQETSLCWRRASGTPAAIRSSARGIAPAGAIAARHMG